MNRPLDSFETGLLAALRAEVAGRTPRTPPARSRRRLVLSAAGVVAASTAAVLVVPGLGVTPAYSV